MSQRNAAKEGPGDEEANLSDRYMEPSKTGRKHVTTACKLCRESKTKVDCVRYISPAYGFLML